MPNQQHVIIDIGGSTLEGFVAFDCDFDDRFRLIDIDTGETLFVNGWLADDVEII